MATTSGRVASRCKTKGGCRYLTDTHVLAKEYGKVIVTKNGMQRSYVCIADPARPILICHLSKDYECKNKCKCDD